MNEKYLEDIVEFAENDLVVSSECILDMVAEIRKLTTDCASKDARIKKLKEILMQT